MRTKLFVLISLMLAASLICAEILNAQTTQPTTQSTKYSTIADDTGTASARYFSIVNITSGYMHLGWTQPWVWTNCTAYTFEFGLWKITSTDTLHPDKIFLNFTCDNPTTGKQEWVCMTYNAYNDSGRVYCGGGGYIAGSVGIREMDSWGTYRTEVIDDPIDGLQTYYFFTGRIWILGLVDERTTVAMGADYNQINPAFASPNPVTVMPVAFQPVKQNNGGTGSVDKVILGKSLPLSDSSVTFELKHHKVKDPKDLKSETIEIQTF